MEMTYLMRQMRSSGSVKAFYWDREALLARLHEVSGEALGEPLATHPPKTATPLAVQVLVKCGT